VTRHSVSNVPPLDYCDTFHDSDEELRRARHELKKAEFDVMRSGRAVDAVNRMDAAKRFLYDNLHWHGPCN